MTASEHYSLDEIQAFRELVAGVSTPDQLCEVLEQVIEWHRSGRFYWPNYTAVDFLEGLKLGVASAGAGPNALGETTELGHWRLLAELISFALVAD